MLISELTGLLSSMRGNIETNTTKIDDLAAEVCRDRSDLDGVICGVFDNSMAGLGKEDAFPPVMQAAYRADLAESNFFLARRSLTFGELQF